MAEARGRGPLSLLYMAPARGEFQNPSEVGEVGGAKTLTP